MEGEEMNPTPDNPDACPVDAAFMDRALALAERGRGSVEPNPMVGAVLVRDGRVLGEGWHGRFGGPHAEVEALAAARAAGVRTRGATMYVTLEPCCHHGKTPPCTQALIEARVARVVVGLTDPDERMAGRGLSRLREAGVAVRSGVRELEARRLLAAYVKLRTRGRPWVLCKWAQTPSGLLALPQSVGRWISCEAARAEVHRLRGVCDGVLVGSGTVRADDPLLTVRSSEPPPRVPARVVLDSALRLRGDSALIAGLAEAPLLVATAADSLTGERADALRAAGVELLGLPTRGGRLALEALLEELGRRQWTNLLVEGGPTVLRSLLENDLADELRVYQSPDDFGVDPAASKDLPRLEGPLELGRTTWRCAEEREVGRDRFRRYLRG
jgi:diaminohydroxyphosphoribosylaminopyrimidine deaminase/5-amino-6-(5-phosphoribosylamino)uracil reductase